MPRFAKEPNCLSSAALASLAAGRLSPLAQQGVGIHLRSCDFCAAELRLHECATGDESVVAAAVAEESFAPPMPLALRVLAESQLADIAAPRLRAA